MARSLKLIQKFYSLSRQTHRNIYLIILVFGFESSSFINKSVFSQNKTEWYDCTNVKLKCNTFFSWNPIFLIIKPSRREASTWCLAKKNSVVVCSCGQSLRIDNNKHVCSWNRVVYWPDRTRPDQTRPDQTRPDQTRPDNDRW